MRRNHYPCLRYVEGTAGTEGGAPAPGAADPTPVPAPPPGTAPADAPLSGDGLAALNRERDARQAAERQLRELRKIQTDAQRASEAEAVTRARTEAEARASAAEERLAAVLAARTRDHAVMAARTAGVPQERVETFLRLVDLSTVGLTDAGDVNTQAIQQAVTVTLDAVPEFIPRAPGYVGTRRADPDAGAGAAPAPANDLAAKVAENLAAMQRFAGIQVSTPAQ